MSMGNLTVGVFVDGLNPSEGGGATLLSTLIRAITNTRHRHRFIVFYKKIHGYDFGNNIQMVDLEKEFPGGFGQKLSRLFSIRPKSVEYYAPLEKAISKYSVEVMWFLSPTDKKVTIPTIYTAWDLYHRVNPIFPEVSVTGWTWDERERTFSSTYPRAARILTGTNAGKDELVHYYRVNPDLVEVIPLPVPYSIQEESHSSDVDIINKYNLGDKYLFCPAQFWPHKNHANIVMALDHLRKKYSFKVDIVFVGSDHGNEKYIRELVRTLDLTDCCHFLGYVPYEDLIHLYRSAYALLYATFIGPDSLPPLEAFALGCPVIASRISGAREQMGEAALYFDPKSPDEMAMVIKKLYDDRELREKLIIRGKDQLRGRKPEDYIHRVDDILDDMAEIRRCWDPRQD